jgi:serine/threonine protein kinase
MRRPKIFAGSACRGERDHPNVASVFHLGRKGRDYFYAMEFVEGETLDNLVKRSRPLEGKLALEITRQVTAGLVAVYKKKLVHRDIKPSNIMVSPSCRRTGCLSDSIDHFARRQSANKALRRNGAFQPRPNRTC